MTQAYIFSPSICAVPDVKLVGVVPCASAENKFVLEDPEAKRWPVTPYIEVGVIPNWPAIVSEEEIIIFSPVRGLASETTGVVDIDPDKLADCAFVPVFEAGVQDPLSEESLSISTLVTKFPYGIGSDRLSYITKSLKKVFSGRF